MQPFESMKEAAGERKTSIIADIAVRLGLGPSVVYRWTQACEDPTDSGQRGPMLTLMLFMEACLVLGRPRQSALKPLQVLNQHFDQIVFSVPERVKDMTPEDLSKELIRCMKELGDVVRRHEEAMADNRMSKLDLKAIDPEVWEAVTQLLVYLYAAREAAK